jgi:polyhydroxyalkanoate synthase
MGTPINLRDVTCDMFVLAGLTDHICPWRACYRAAHQFGGRTEFVMGGSGHVQSLVSPPGNFKAKYFVNPRLADDAEGWLKAATEQKGTWWDYWIEWMEKRSGNKRAAPATMGGGRYTPIEPAPGRYVHQRP